MNAKLFSRNLKQWRNRKRNLFWADDLRCSAYYAYTGYILIICKGRFYEHGIEYYY